MGVKKIRFRSCGIGIKPCSEGTKRLVRAAIEYAITNDRDSVHFNLPPRQYVGSSPKARLKTGATSWRATSSTVSLLTAVVAEN